MKEGTMLRISNENPLVLLTSTAEHLVSYCFWRQVLIRG